MGRAGIDTEISGTVTERSGRMHGCGEEHWCEINTRLWLYTQLSSLSPLSSCNKYSILTTTILHSSVPAFFPIGKSILSLIQNTILTHFSPLASYFLLLLLLLLLLHLKYYRPPSLHNGYPSRHLLVSCMCPRNNAKTLCPSRRPSSRSRPAPELSFLFSWVLLYALFVSLPLSHFLQPPNLTAATLTLPLLPLVRRVQKMAQFAQEAALCTALGVLSQTAP